MKILQVNKAYFPHIGGIETIVQQLAEGLVNSLHYETEVLVCNSQARTESTLINNVPVTYTSSLAKILSLPISPSYITELANRKADVFHLHEPFPLGDLAYLALKSKHNFKHLFISWHSDIIRQKLFYILYAPLIRYTLRLADCIIVATPNHITSSKFLPEVREKCRVVHYGVNIDRFKQTSDSIALAQQFRQLYGTPLILFVGRLVYYKGVEYLIEAMRYVPHAHLVIVGNGPLESKLRQMASELSITFLPPQDETNLVALYKACDVFVLPSVANSEQFGIVQLEAMACGKPVIATTLSTGVSYVNQHEKTGLLVPPANAFALGEAIANLLQNNDLRLQMGEYARQRVQAEFTLTGMVNRVANLYHSYE